MNLSDLNNILGAMDTGYNHQADLDGDGEVSSTDLSIVLGNMDLFGEL